MFDGTLPHITTINAFSFSTPKGKWERIPAPKRSSPQQITMRRHQALGYSQLIEASHMLITAPMGSGKTKLMMFVSAGKMLQDANLRTIFVVPQTIIGKGFTGQEGPDKHAILILPDGSGQHWSPISR